MPWLWRPVKRWISAWNVYDPQYMLPLSVPASQAHTAQATGTPNRSLRNPTRPNRVPYPLHLPSQSRPATSFTTGPVGSPRQGKPGPLTLSLLTQLPGASDVAALAFCKESSASFKKGVTAGLATTNISQKFFATEINAGQGLDVTQQAARSSSQRPLCAPHPGRKAKQPEQFRNGDPIRSYARSCDAANDFLL